jgi:hypothetical protein
VEQEVMGWPTQPDLFEVYEENDPAVYCKHCGQPMDWIECDACGGEGFFDGERLMEEDPLWYDEDDTEGCSDCTGDGGWWHCFNETCPSKK